MQLYLDCFSGISGDMTLGALVHLGVPAEWLKETLAKMPLDGFDLQVQPVVRHGIGATQVVVVVPESHHHRHYSDICEMLSASPYSEQVKAYSLAIFDKIATAEAAIHAMPKEKVHFHEVGSMDAIIDVVGTCLGMEYLGIERVVASSLPLGHGFVQCQHGTLPVPAPATLEILKGVPVYAGEVAQEMVTPTGAAIAATLAKSFEPLPQMQVEKIGYGVGTRELKQQPNLLRVMMGPVSHEGRDGGTRKLVMVETSVDDMNPELFGYLMEKLFEDGALDLHWVPIQMKKNRPGTLVQVLCEPEKRPAIVDRILTETTSLGVRHYDVYRTSLAREIVQVQTPFGRLRAKKVTYPNGNYRMVPEFEVCKQIATSKQMPLREVYDRILQSFKA